MSHSRHWRCFSFFLIYVCAISWLVASVQAQGCSQSNPCAEGCCSTAGYCGLGPDFCGPGNCTANCDRKAECNPGWSDPKYSSSENCPLNVCCSPYGFCGTTKDFCGNKTVKRPSCGEKSPLSRVIGYYEGWSTYERSCDKFYPEQIPTGAYTHLNFAFASINPKTFSLVPADPRDTELYKRLTDLKLKDPNLQVFISVGGWAFNDPGVTRPVFGELAASESKQQAFFKSLISFMSTYNFDGLDLDWEYPGASDRGGTKDDFENFPRFLSNLKAALKSSGRSGLSITLPASYWYLQNFDVVGLAKDIDWFNVMTYDLHGTWDKASNVAGNKWEGPYLNAHTNLTEITDALDLLWRNKIDPDQVVLGMAFYGRSFTTTSISCMEPGCTYLSGGDAGKCSGTVGLLLNSEINATVSDKHLKPQLNKAAAVKIATWNDQWVAYDDPDTFKLKVDFARSECMSGVMVWAVSHDTEDAYYSTALAEVVGRPIALADTSGSEPYSDITKNLYQCRWTNCNEPCGSGWMPVARTDSDARDGELMVDSTGCNGIGLHTFCCPGDQEQPSCGWYGFNNGKCSNFCPSGMTEIGGNSQYCNNGGYEAACCSTNVSPMSVYETCEWDTWPNCPGSPCAGPSTIEQARSWTGSGAAFCHPDNFIQPSDDYDFGLSGRRLCCDAESSSPDAYVHECQWYDHIGFGPDGDECLSGCPVGTLRVAMDQWGGECNQRGGARANCCAAVALQHTTVENPEITQYRHSLQDWIVSQTCSNPGELPPAAILKRGVDALDGMILSNATTTTLERRGPEGSEEVVLFLLYTILSKSASPSMLGAEEDLWDNAVRSPYPALVTKDLIPFVDQTPSFYIKGPEEIAHDIMCHPAWFNAMSADFQASAGSQTALSCNYTLCQMDGWPACSDDDEIEEDDDSTGTNDGSTTSSRLARRLSDLWKRTGKKRKYETEVDDNVVATTYSLEYPQADDFDQDNPIRDQAYDAEDRSDCLDTAVSWNSIGPAGTNSRWHAEHPVELQTIRDYFEAIGNGILSSKSELPQGRVDLDFFNTVNDRQYLEDHPIGEGGLDSGMPADQLYNCLGSEYNQAPFVLADRDINLMKARIWGLKKPASNKIMAARLKTGTVDSVSKALTEIKKVSFALVDFVSREPTVPELVDLISFQAFIVIQYLRDTKVNDNLVFVINCVTGVLQLIEDKWNADRGDSPYEFIETWKLFIRDHMETMVSLLQDWIEAWLVKMENRFPDSSAEPGAQVQEMIATYRNYLSNGNFEIPLDGMN